MTFEIRVKAKPFYVGGGLYVRLYSAMLKHVETPTYKGWRVVPFERQLAWFGREGIPLIPVGVGHLHDQRLCLAPISLLATHVMEKCYRCKNGFSGDAGVFDYTSQVNQWVDGALSTWNHFSPKHAETRATAAMEAMGLFTSPTPKKKLVFESVPVPPPNIPDLIATKVIEGQWLDEKVNQYKHVVFGNAADEPQKIVIDSVRQGWQEVEADATKSHRHKEETS